MEEHERHSVANRNANQFASRLALAELWSFPHNLIELLHNLPLFVDEQLRVTHHIYEQDVRNLKVRIGFGLSRHVCAVSKHYNTIPSR